MQQNLTSDQAKAIVKNYFQNNNVGVVVSIDSEPATFRTNSQGLGIWLVNIHYETENIHYNASMRDGYPAERTIEVGDTVAVEDVSQKIIFQYYFGGSDKFEIFH